MLEAMGLLLALAGMAIEAVAVIAGVWYPVRRRIGLSPFELQSLGFFAWLGGVMLVGVACAFHR